MLETMTGKEMIEALLGKKDPRPSDADCYLLDAYVCINEYGLEIKVTGNKCAHAAVINTLGDGFSEKFRLLIKETSGHLANTLDDFCEKFDKLAIESMEGK